MGWIRRTAALAAFVAIVLGFGQSPAAAEQTSYIKWVDFDVSAAAMKKTLETSVKLQETKGISAHWVDMLAWLGVKCGGDFSKYKAKHLDELTRRLEAGEAMEDITRDMKHYGYYQEAYGAVLGGLAGEIKADGEARYGLTAYHPIAKGFDYSHYDDFGDGRSYGYKRRHLGHDFMALTGTPVIAMESGIIEELGWNQYGGWRIGIRSHDGLRYYYYAHLRQNRPFAAGLEKGQSVEAGSVIGYVGRTGYSRKENTNGIKQSHLHFGLQLIFDESQKDGTNQIWVDVYEITKLLQSRRMAVVRDPETKEYSAAG